MGAPVVLLLVVTVGKPSQLLLQPTKVELDLQVGVEFDNKLRSNIPKLCQTYRSYDPILTKLYWRVSGIKTKQNHLHTGCFKKNVTMFVAKLNLNSTQLNLRLRWSLFPFDPTTHPHPQEKFHLKLERNQTKKND